MSGETFPTRESQVRCGGIHLGWCLRPFYFSLNEQGTTLDILCYCQLLLLLAVVGVVALIGGGGATVKIEQQNESKHLRATETVTLQEVREATSGRTSCPCCSGLMYALNIRVGGELRGPSPGYEGDSELPEVIFIITGHPGPFPEPTKVK